MGRPDALDSTTLYDRRDDQLRAYSRSLAASARSLIKANRAVDW